MVSGKSHAQESSPNRIKRVHGDQWRAGRLACNCTRWLNFQVTKTARSALLLNQIIKIPVLRGG